MHTNHTQGSDSMFRYKSVRNGEFYAFQHSPSHVGLNTPLMCKATDQNLKTDGNNQCSFFLHHFIRLRKTIANLIVRLS